MNSTSADVTVQTHRFPLGAFTVHVVNDGDVTFPVAMFGVTAQPQELVAARLALGLGEQLTMPMNVVVVDTGAHRVLVDGGAGPGLPNAGRLRVGLAHAGIDPASIDTVVVSHLHPDHVGGLLGGDGALTFAAARHVLPREEHAYWAADPALGELNVPGEQRAYLRQAARQFLARAGDRLERLEFGAEVVPGVTLVRAVGHTPGHAAIEVHSGGERLLHVVDAFAWPDLHVPHPEWVGVVDSWPAHLIPTRRALLEQAGADRDTRVLGYHWPFPGVGRVTRDGDGWRYTADGAGPA